MFDERTFLARIEAMGPDEFAQQLMHPIAEEERALRSYFGDERYDRLHQLALLRSRRARNTSPENVVVIHGIMGGELTATRGAERDRIWARAFALAAGRVTSLRLDDSGRTDLDHALWVEATGIMKRSYGEILLALGAHRMARAFWFDWRKDLTLAAADLAAKITGWFGPAPEKSVHLVAHSMGGLVARTFIMNHRDQWEAMKGRLVMLGTPNYGSFAIPQVITGLEGMVQKLAWLDLSHDLNDLLPVFNSFVGSYQMLPAPQKMPEMDWLYDAASYLPVVVPQRHLDTARAHHERLHLEHGSHPEDATRMSYIAGYNRPTLNGFKENKPRDPKQYTATYAGDGRVPHLLGLLDGVQTWYVDEGHGDLPENRLVISAVEDLLDGGTTTGLPTAIEVQRGAPTPEQAKEELDAQEYRDLAQFQVLAERKRARVADPTAARSVGPLEREVEESLTTGFLASPARGEDAERRAAPARRRARNRAEGGAPAKLPETMEVHVAVGGIQDSDALNGHAPPLDAVAVGHYLGVKPQNAEEAIDIAISSKLLPRRINGISMFDAQGIPLERYRLIAQYTERGTVRGELGQPFFIADPRDGAAEGRSIVLAGMGMPGRFGQPELVVLVRELLWALGRLGKRHLGTVLIGAGEGNLSIEQAVAAWVAGMRRVTQSNADERERVRRVTFVELDPHRAGRILQALEQERHALESALVEETEAEAALQLVIADPISRDELRARQRKWDRDTMRKRQEREDEELAKREARASLEREEEGAVVDEPETPSKDRVPTRIAVSFDHDAYRFGAITDEASIPERDIAIDRTLVERANDELVAESRPAHQEEHGRFLGQLLIPEELRPKLAGSAPVVMMVDSTTARIHWEMVAYSVGTDERRGGEDEWAVPPRGGLRDFLGTNRGFTRQLRTTFAAPPEPPPPPRRVLRVLVVADPAADAHLPGAEEEGAEVADLFESFNTVYGGGDPQLRSSVKVVRLFGPVEATRVRVMKELMTHSYDVLHYCGHCTYDKQYPSRSGWIFSNGEILSARELQRIDRVPKFVFSNACESGITPDRAGERAVDLAPSFAEAFFARGVVNFVCTAWPVDDTAASLFARRLYGALIGLEPVEDGSRYRPTERVAPMHEAMRLARLAAAQDEFGITTWGAYQHYGNPFLRFFDAARLREQMIMQDRAAPRATSGATKKHAPRGRKEREPVVHTPENAMAASIGAESFTTTGATSR